MMRPIFVFAKLGFYASRLRVFRFIAATLCFASTGNATESQLSSRLPLEKSKKSTEYSLGVSQESLLMRERPPGGYAEETRVAGRLRTRPSGEKQIAAALDVSGSVATGVGRESMWQVPEAYVSWTNAPLSESRATIALGRKRDDWSRLDRDWSLGLWQPLHRFDALRASEQGLTGVFAGFRSESFEILALASPMHIPEQGPGFQLREGRFETTNPWFSEPTDRLVLFGRPTNIHYSVEMPSVQSAVMHPAGGLLARIGQDRGARGQVAYIKKPRNQLSLPYDGVLNITRDEAQVRIVPQVSYHNLLSLDSSYRGEGWAVGLASLADISDEESVPQELTYQSLKPLYLVSPSIEARLFPSKRWGPTVKLSALESIGGETEMHGPLRTDRDPFASRTIYRRAIAVDARARMWQSTNYLFDQGVKWINETFERGQVFMMDASLANRAGWRVNAYLDVLSSDQPAATNHGFISRFRGNDRAGLQINYLF